MRQFNYRNYNAENICPPDFEGVPIIAANMDGVGTFEMADKLAEGEIMTCLKKTYTSAELISYFDSEMWERREYVAMSIGISDSDLNKFKTVYDHVGKELKYVCIDVANGYTERFVNFIQEFRLLYADIVIIAGNVVTADQTQELILNGARYC